ncbi:MAG: NAD-dependent epimerase/dehydratase family protein [Candidatus Omnitrophota bacterium]
MIPKKDLKKAVASQDASIKDVMRLIDHSGLRVAYIVDDKKRLIGAASDSEIRKAILKGSDVSEKVKAIINPHPVFLREKDLSNGYVAKKAVRELRARMPDSRYILVVDGKGRPCRMAFCDAITGENALRPHRKRVMGRNILVVGGAGYLGSILVRRLLEHGARVKVLDLLMYGAESMDGLAGKRNFTLVEGDMRNISTMVRSLEGVDSVVNLAAIVGDPACKNKPEAAIETNYLANKVLAEACRYHQINRFIYASTCSVYGMMDDELPLDEDSPLNPVSLYARSKIRSEEGVLGLVDENFSPTILRMGTLYGYSPRMRFDLVVNTMTKTAMVEKRIKVHGGGRQWRPLVHVKDAAEAYVRCLESPINAVKGEVFNVGSDGQNYQIFTVAEVVQRHVPGSRLINEGESKDQRNYNVSFAKAASTLGLRAANDLKEGVIEIRKWLMGRSAEDLEDARYYNVEYGQ